MQGHLTFGNHPFNRNFRFFSPLFRELRELEQQQDESIVPAADVTETAKALELKLDLPGVAPEDIDVKLENDTLTISATRKAEKTEEGKDATWLRRERTVGVMSRSFTLPPTVDGSKPEAAYKHGVLTITLPKTEEAKPKHIDVSIN